MLTHLKRSQHNFLNHHYHRKAYFCQWCEYADLVTERFADHLQFEHDKVEDAERFFKECDVFGKLIQCHFDGCGFRTTKESKLRVHMLDHSPTTERDPEIAKIQIEHLQEALRQALKGQYRDNIAQQSAMNKTAERRHGLVSPPISLVIEMEKPTQPVRPERATPPSPNTPTRTTAMGSPVLACARRNVGRGRGLDAFVREYNRMRDEPCPGGARPSPPRYRRTMFDNTMTRSNRRIHQFDQHLFEMVRMLPLPPATGRPQYTPLERAVKMRPLWRYVAELRGTTRPTFLGFGRCVQPMVGALTPTDESAMKKNPVISGVCVSYHTGAPGTGARFSPNQMRWKFAGAIFDVETRPWMVTRKIQIAYIPEDGLYQIIDPEREEMWPVELFTLH